MIYDIENENQDLETIEQVNKYKIRKKAIICGIIIFVCLVVMAISIVISYNMKNSENTEKNVFSGKNQYKGNHVQIKEHDLDAIKTKFVPEENPNAQEQIKNIYFSKEKVAYLTFDDGPSKNITPQILDILKEENIPATFFVVGSRVELNPDLVKREYDEGHYIANHGYTHQYSKIYRSKDTVFEEYVKCEDAIKVALNNPNYNSYLFRFPGGSSGGVYASIKAEAKTLLNSNCVNQTNWNCMTGDAEGRTTTESLMSCLKETMQGDDALIVLMHDASDKTYTAENLKNVISYLREHGYTFKNFYEIF